jgi:hypothetical protein
MIAMAPAALENRAVSRSVMHIRLQAGGRQFSTPQDYGLSQKQGGNVTFKKTTLTVHEQ